MDRRDFLRNVALATAAVSVRGIAAQDVIPTPPQVKGPFYPDNLPLDTDNDLVILGGAGAAAIGEITWLSGRIFSASGQPVRNAVVEIWQVDRYGAYLHSRSANRDRRDRNFQGFGRFLTGSSGEYVFRTIKPVAYARRAPHIHFNIEIQGQEPFTTQCYIQGEVRNATDQVLNTVRDPKARAALIVPFVPVLGSRTRELSAQFNIVLGVTPRQG